MRIKAEHPQWAQDEWRLAEASSKDKAQLEALGIPIT